MTKPAKKPHPVDVHVGRQLRIRRLSLGLSQTEVAKRLGLTFQQIQKNEKGANRIGAGRLYDLAEILDVPVSYFYDGLGERPRAPTGTLSAEVLATAALLERVSDPAVRRKLRALIRSLAGARDDGDE